MWWISTGCIIYVGSGHAVASSAVYSCYEVVTFESRWGDHRNVVGTAGRIARRDETQMPELEPTGNNGRCHGPTNRTQEPLLRNIVFGSSSSPIGSHWRHDHISQLTLLRNVPSAAEKQHTFRPVGRVRHTRGNMKLVIGSWAHRFEQRDVIFRFTNSTISGLSFKFNFFAAFNLYF